MNLRVSVEEDLQTVYPGRIRAIEDCANAEKQKTLPPLMEPIARAMKLVRTAAEISKTFEYKSDFGATMSCSIPSKQPRKKATGRSMKRAPKANGPTEALARPYTRTRSQGGCFCFLSMISSSRWVASSTPTTSCTTSL